MKTLSYRGPKLENYVMVAIPVERVKTGRPYARKCKKHTMRDQHRAVGYVRGKD